MSARVLCVDDDRNLCRILAKTLGGEGYEVATAFDGEEALGALREAPPDLVLLDLILPKRNGFEVLEAIRRSPHRGADAPVVLMSGCSPTPEYRRRAARLRATDLLEKPVPLDRLLGVVGRALGARSGAQPAPAAPQAAAAPRGALDEMPFPWLLHHLHGLRATGVLQLSSGRKRKWLQLVDGRPTAVRSNLVEECLGNLLVRQGRISSSALDESLRRMQGGHLQGEILVAMQRLSEDELTAALRAQAAEKLLEIFAWESGAFRFHGGARLRNANALERSPADLIVHGVRTRFPLRRIDEFLRAHGERYAGLGESRFYRFQEIELAPGEEALLRGLRGGARRLADLVGPDEGLRRTLFGLLSVGLVELAEGPPPATGPAPAAPPAATGPAPAAPASAARPEPLAPAAAVGREPAAPPAAEGREPAAPPSARAARDEGAQRDERARAELLALAESFRDRSHWEILGVAEDAGDGEIRAAYERLAARTHPDRFGGRGGAVKDLAEELFARVAEAGDTLSDPKRRLAYLLESRRRTRQAAHRDEGQRALRAERAFRDGEACLQRRDYPGALRAFGIALERYPEEGEYHAHYGWALHLCHPGDASLAQEAVEHVRRGAKLARNHEKPYLFLGRLYKSLGRPQAAERLFAKAVQVQPDCVEAMRELRLIQMRRERSRGARARIRRLFGR